MTDAQRAQVYAAEALMAKMLERGGPAQVAGSTLTLPIERRFGNLDNVRDYIERLHSIFGEGMPMPQVRERKGQAEAHYEWANHTIAVPLKARWALRESVILHEYAHALTWRRDNSPDPGHGPDFQSNLEHLFTEAIGPEAGFMFRYLLQAS